MNITETSYYHRRMICESSPTCCRVAAAPAGVPVRYSGHTTRCSTPAARLGAQWRACRSLSAFCPTRRALPYSLIDSIFQILTADHNTHQLHSLDEIFYLSCDHPPSFNNSIYQLPASLPTPRSPFFLERQDINHHKIKFTFAKAPTEKYAIS